MSGIVEAGLGDSGLTLDGYIRNASRQVWNGTAFEDFDSAHLSLYATPFTEQGTMGYYTFTFPPAIAAGLYSVQIKRRAGVSPAQDDTTEGIQTLPPWDGTEFESGWSTPSRILTDAGASTVDTGVALSAEGLSAQLTLVNAAITAALANPAPNWSVGQVKFNQTEYLSILCAQRDKLIEQIRKFPCESIDTVQNGVGVLGNDATDYYDENP